MLSPPSWIGRIVVVRRESTEPLTVLVDHKLHLGVLEPYWTSKSCPLKGIDRLAATVSRQILADTRRGNSQLGSVRSPLSLLCDVVIDALKGDLPRLIHVRLQVLFVLSQIRVEFVIRPSRGVQLDRGPSLESAIRHSLGPWIFRR